MGRAGRPTVAIGLTDEEREPLLRWSRRHSSSQALALRSRIVLACADGRPNTKIADELGCDRVAVGKWRHRFAAERLEGLVDAPRPGAARTISDEDLEAVVVESLETTPKDATHWSTRSMAQRHGIGRQTVSEIAPLPVPLLLHPHLRVVDESRRAMVLSPDHQEAPTLGAPQRPSARPGHPRLGRDLERHPPTLHLAPERRGDPRPTRRLLPPLNKWRALQPDRTPAGCGQRSCATPAIGVYWLRQRTRMAAGRAGRGSSMAAEDNAAIVFVWAQAAFNQHDLEAAAVGRLERSGSSAALRHGSSGGEYATVGR
jgi:transposase